MPEPSVSVIIPAYNCEQTIAPALEAISAQTYNGPLEVIVVDDGSTDKTASVIQSFKKVIYIHQDNTGPATARNQGAHLARGEILFFTDADCVPEPQWIEKMLKPLQEPQIGVVAGSYGIANPQERLAYCIHQEICFRHQSLMPQYPKAFGSYNFCIRRNIFNSVGGFNTEYRYASGEDNDLSYKILKAGYKIYFERNAIVEHFHPFQLNRYLKEQYRHGFWRAKMYFDHPGMTGGDNYTFWKDIIEVPLVLINLFSLLGSTVGFASVPAISCISSFLILIIIQVIFAFLIIKEVQFTPYFMVVMFLRAYLRTLGFISGVIFFFSKSSKKVK